MTNENLNNLISKHSQQANQAIQRQLCNKLYLMCVLCLIIYSNIPSS